MCDNVYVDIHVSLQLTLPCLFVFRRGRQGLPWIHLFLNTELSKRKDYIGYCHVCNPLPALDKVLAESELAQNRSDTRGPLTQPGRQAAQVDTSSVFSPTLQSHSRHATLANLASLEENKSCKSDYPQNIIGQFFGSLKIRRSDNASLLEENGPSKT
ncbi:hypothetical protein Bbelb_227690 [Branchiostoma belcheri]|nr:hypothetical protein Bbelb_227690 [Branchiostoma belcheri]